MGIVTDIALPLALAFIMFALGLGLTVADFARVARNPRDFLVGFVCQIVLLPAVAFVLILVWPMPPELALGLMIIAAAPGGVTSNIMTAFARGDVALSISLTAVISLVSVLTIPFIVVFAHDWLFGADHATGGIMGGDASITKTAVSVFAIVTVPVLIGLGFRHFAQSTALKIEPTTRIISTILFAVVLVGAIAQEFSNITTYFAQAGLVTLALNLVMMALAYGIATGLASGVRQRIAISIECGLQNGTLAIAVAALLFGGGLTVIPAATYSVIMFGTALLFIAFLRRRHPDG